VGEDISSFTKRHLNGFVNPAVSGQGLRSIPVAPEFCGERIPASIFSESGFFVSFFCWRKIPKHGRVFFLYLFQASFIIR
jgi:hypothetical protein